MSNETNAGKSTCFIDMPFGKKADPKSGIEVDFDQIYSEGIKPAVEAAGLECIRGDMERSGGIIHTAMFARLLLSEFVVADLTMGNPNVFYELGVRHTARPYTTIPIFATISDLPFDVSLVRAIPYDLKNGRLSNQAQVALKTAIKDRIESVLKGPLSKDSPLFQLFDEFPGIQMSHEVTDVFRSHVEYSEEFKDRLADARIAGSKEKVRDEIRAIQSELGNLKAIERGVLVDLFLSYRDAEAFEDMIALYKEFPSELKHAMITRQQYGFALNRNGDWRKALRVLEKVIADFGESAETYGLLGRVYKDRYKASDEGDPARTGYLEKAIAAYTKGFEAEPMDYYPGVNAITLLALKAEPESRAEIDRLLPLVMFAVLRQGGAESSDYWTLATVLELALVGGDRNLTNKVLPRLLATDAEGWMFQTTLDNLGLFLKQQTNSDYKNFMQKCVDEIGKKLPSLEDLDRREE
jgi:tetratricopeptide (TPR) repeat protein